MNKFNYEYIANDVQGLFNNIVEKYPSKIAVNDELSKLTITFDLLQKQAKTLSLLISHSHKYSDDSTTLVAIMTNRSIGTIVAMLAILFAQCGYMPIDVGYPTDRQQYMLTHSKVRHIIVDKESFGRLKLFENQFIDIIVIDNCGNVIDRHQQNFIDNDMQLCSFGNIAYVLYTSGSTGKPKGVCVFNRGLVNVVQHFMSELHISSHDIVLGLTTFCFDISMLEVFISLCSGSLLVLVSTQSQKSPRKIIQLLQDHRVTLLQATPTTYEMLISTGWRGDCNIQFLVGGEAFRPSLLPLVHNSKAVLNVYGPTETTIWSSSYRVTAEAIASAVCVPIGKPISGTKFHLIPLADDNPHSANDEFDAYNTNIDDKNNCGGCDTIVKELVGELCISGQGVAAGYLHQPDLTSQRFVRSSEPSTSSSSSPLSCPPYLLSPSTSKPLLTSSSVSRCDGDSTILIMPAVVAVGDTEEEVLMYHTGDVVRLRRDGNFVFERRNDSQVKLHGFRIELEEVEAVLSKCHEVTQAVVMVLSDTLVAFITVTLSGKHRHSHESSVVDNTCALSNEAQSFFLDGTEKWNDDGMLDNIRSVASLSLPHYMVPRHIIPLRYFPTTDNGKLDKLTLAKLPYLDIITQSQLSHGSLKLQQPSSHQSSRDDDDTLNHHSKQSSSSMLSFVSQLLHEITGKTFTPQASLVVVGVDSLGAVAFQNVLISRLGGHVTVEMTELYSGSVTVKSLAVMLFERMQQVDPVTLNDQLGIHSALDQDSLYLDDQSLGDKPNQLSGCAIKFNPRLLDSIRGLLIILVTYDHFFHNATRSGGRIRTDTALFLVTSGFAVGVQTLMSGNNPVAFFMASYLGLQSTHANKRNDFSTFRRENDDTRSISNLGHWDAKRFLLGKAVGLFPAYWVAIALNIPRRALCYNTKNFVGEVEHYPLSELIVIVCAYIPALQAWPWRDYSHILLDLHYVSLIWAAFLVYSCVMTVAHSTRLTSYGKLGLYVTIVLIVLAQHKNIANLNAGYGPSEACVFFGLGLIAAHRFAHFQAIIDSDHNLKVSKGEDEEAACQPSALSLSLSSSSPHTIVMESQSEVTSPYSRRNVNKSTFPGLTTQVSSQLSSPSSPLTLSTDSPSMMATCSSPKISRLFNNWHYNKNNNSNNSTSSRSSSRSTNAQLITSTQCDCIMSHMLTAANMICRAMKSLRRFLWAVSSIDLMVMLIVFLIFFNSWGQLLDWVCQDNYRNHATLSIPSTSSRSYATQLLVHKSYSTLPHVSYIIKVWDRILERIVLPVLFSGLLTQCALAQSSDFYATINGNLNLTHQSDHLKIQHNNHHLQLKRMHKQSFSVFVWLLLRSKCLPMLGECSFAIYVFQNIFVAFYITHIFVGMEQGEFPFTCSFANRNSYIYNHDLQHWTFRLAAVLISVIASVCLQRFLLDKIVAACLQMKWN